MATNRLDPVAFHDQPKWAIMEAYQRCRALQQYCSPNYLVSKVHTWYQAKNGSFLLRKSSLTPYKFGYVEESIAMSQIGAYSNLLEISFAS